MYRIFLAAVDIVPAAVVLIPLFTFLHFTVYGRNVKKSTLHCLFSLYLAALFSLVGIPNLLYFRPEVNLNWIPFRGMMGDLKNSVLNVALFVPLGFLLPLVGEGYRRGYSTVLFGFGLSLTVELLQMLTFRATDVNDLITNTLGTLIGFLLVKPLVRKYPAAGKGRKVAFLLAVLSFCVMFFVHPFLSPMIWDRVL